MRSIDEIVELLEWCHTRGALHIKVGETVEVMFPPPDIQLAKPTYAGGTPPPLLTEDPAAEYDQWVEAYRLSKMK
jgi:hypothetical protein